MTLEILSEEDCQYDVMSVGECMIRLSPPGHGRLEFATQLEVWVGGVEYNVSYALSRLGLRTGWVGKLPDNPLGLLIMNHGRAVGVDMQHVLLVPYDGVGKENRVGLNFTEVGTGLRSSVTMYDRGHSATSQMAPGEVAAEVGPPKGRRASDILEVLEKIKKTEPEEDGEVCYYEHQGKILVDSECIITAMHSHLEEGKKLYEKLAQTESPKDQFFVKQEIIRHQEALRGIIEIATKLLEKENSSLPQHTTEVINEKVLKDLLENLSMQNWSNQDDFTFFDEYAIKVKSQFDARLEPKVDFLRSILMELGIQ